MFLRATVLSAVLLLLAQAARADVEAPTPVPGDAWRYSEREGFSRVELGTWRIEVVTSTGSEARLIVTGGRPGAERTPEVRIFSAAGVLETGRLSDRVFGTFRPGLKLLPFPLVEGKAWSQTVNRTDPATGRERTITLHGKVLGWESVKVPAGEFRALKIVRELDLGDGEVFRYPTHRTEYEWYVPELKSAARIEIWEQYHDYSVSRTMRARMWDKYFLDLVSFQPHAN